MGIRAWLLRPIVSLVVKEASGEFKKLVLKDIDYATKSLIDIEKKYKQQVESITASGLKTVQTELQEAKDLIKSAQSLIERLEGLKNNLPLGLFRN